MALRIQKWGNSLALRIPKPFADELHWAQDTEVRTTVIDGKLVIEAVEPSIYHLDELLATITPEQLHGEISTGRVVGNEEW